MKKVGERIKKLRKQHKHTLQDLGDKLNFNYSNLSKIERGERKPSLDLLEQIADLYNVSVSFILDEELTPQERDFMSDLDLTDDELIEKYNLIVDGKKVSDKEIKMMLSVVRSLRKTEE